MKKKNEAKIEIKTNSDVDDETVIKSDNKNISFFTVGIGASAGGLDE